MTTHERPGCCCSDLKEINEAKVANLLAYLDEAVATNTSAANCSGIPLTSTALHNNTVSFASVGQQSLPSSIAAPSGGADPHRHHRQLATSPLASGHSQSSGPKGRTEKLGGGHSSYHTSAVDSAQATYVGIKQKLESLKLDKEDLLHENNELRVRLQAWKDRDEARRVEVRDAVQGEMNDLRSELESLKKRSSQQLRKLSEEKAELQCSVDAMALQLRQEMLRREEERQKLEAANAAAMTALKSKWQAQEKAAREKWKLSEAKRIKETTLQSLEPDIVLLLNRHKAEKVRLREEYENELRRRDEAIAAKDSAMEELRARVQREAEATLSREQLAYQSRLQEETERIRRRLEEERRSEKAKREQMESFFEEEKAAMQREIARLGREMLELRGSQTKEEVAFHEAVAKEVARVTGQSTDMLAALREKLMLEYTCREKAAAEHNAVYLQSKEKELRRQCELERDAAITQVVQKLEEEHIKAMTSSRGNDDLFRERYNQLSRDNERLKVEQELLREQVKGTLKAKESVEAQLASLKEMQDLSQEKVKAIEDRVKAQFNAKIGILDNVWQGRLSELESQHAKEMCAAQIQIDSLNRELEMVQRRTEQEQRAAEQRHHAELHHINERVLVAMTQKETALQSQSEQILSLREALEVRDRELERHRQLLEQ